MEIAFVGLEVQQHQHEEIQDENGAGIDDDLHRPEKLGIEQHEEAGHMEQQGQRARGRNARDASVRHRQDARSHTGQCKINEKDRNHRFGFQLRCLGGGWVGLTYRLREVIPVFPAFLNFLFLIVGIQIFFRIVEMALADVV